MTAFDFTVAHVEGTYAVVERGHGGRGVAVGLGLITFDGAGGLTGRLVRNVPGARIGERDVLDLAGSGTYTMTAQGMISAGMGGDDTLRLAVRGVDADAHRAPRVNELAMIGRDLDGASGCLMTGVATRRPEGAVFAAHSLQGLYVGAALGLGGQWPAAGFGFVRYDGQGGFRETNVANVQADTVTSRRFVDGSDEGSYALEADGTGTVAGGAVSILITRTRVVDDVALAEEYGFMVRDFVPANGAHFSGTIKRISD